MTGRGRGVATGTPGETTSRGVSRDGSSTSNLQTVTTQQLPSNPTAVLPSVSNQRQNASSQLTAHPTVANAPANRRPTRSKSRGRSRGPSKSSNSHPTVPTLSSHPLVLPTSTVRKWTDLFKPSSTPSTQVNQTLSYVPPVSIDGKRCGVVSEKGVKAAVARWDRVLVGYVIGAHPQAAGLARYVKWLWQLKGFIEVQHRGNGFFLFKFSNEAELCKVLEGGPWFICARPLVLQRWTPDSNFEHQRFTTLPLWIRLPLLPLRFWSKEAMAVIGSLLGVPIMVDAPTAKGNRLEYARLCVEIDLDFDYPTEVHIFNSSTKLMEIIKVEYEWKPSPCTHCQTFGHLEDTCVARHLAKGKTPMLGTSSDLQWRVVVDKRQQGIHISNPSTTAAVEVVSISDSIAGNSKDTATLHAKDVMLPITNVTNVLDSSITPSSAAVESSIVAAVSDVPDASIASPALISPAVSLELPSSTVEADHVVLDVVPDVPSLVELPSSTLVSGVVVEETVAPPIVNEIEVSKAVIPNDSLDCGVRTRSRVEVDSASLHARVDSLPKSRVSNKETLRLQLGPRDRKKEKLLREERADGGKASTMPLSP